MILRKSAKEPKARFSSRPLQTALLETLYVLVFSTASFTLGALALWWLEKKPSYTEALSLTYGNGELWIFATAFLGPSILLLGKDASDVKPPAGRLFFIVIVVSLLILCSFGYAYSKSVASLGHDIKTAVDSSLYLAGIAIFMRGLVLYAYNARERIDASEIFRKDQDSFIAGYASRRSE